MAFPLMLYAQAVRGLSPTRAALLLVPMAVISGMLAPFVGRLVDRVHPRYVAGLGLLAFPVSLTWLWLVMTPDSAVWQLLLPIALLGVANGFMWSPLSTTATRNLPLHQAGAGAGVYNTTRQVGAVLGSAGIAVLMESRLAAELSQVGGGAPGAGSFETAVGSLPPALHEGFAAAMGQSMLLPAGVLLIGLVAALCFARPAHLRRTSASTAGAPGTPGSSEVSGAPAGSGFTKV
jgi:MFS family permease